jgi:hypothetical protein
MGLAHRPIRKMTNFVRGIVCLLTGALTGDAAVCEAMQLPDGGPASRTPRSGTKILSHPDVH